MRLSVGGRLLLVALAAGACGGADARTIRLARVELPGTACDPPAGARQLYVEALGDFGRDARSSPPGDELRVADFPPRTREIAVEVLGIGDDNRVGRSGTLALEDLPDGTVLHLLIAPPSAFCAVGALGTARVEPVAVRAGTGVLVAGGGEGAEWFDPTTATFTAAREAPHPDLAGARGAPLPDGRALLLYEEGWQVFDPAGLSFDDAQPNTRLHRDAQVVVRPDGKVLVTGGCASSGDRAPCVASNDTQIFDPATAAWAAAFPPAIPRAGGVAVAAESGRVWLVGGSSDVTGAPVDPELWDPEGDASTAVAPFAGGDAVGLVGGGLFAGFGASGEGVVVAPLGGGLTAVAGAGTRSGATLTGLEDGAVLIVGGGAAGTAGATRFRPQLGGGIEALDFAAGEALTGHAAVRLGDGAVLVVGGHGDDGVARADAWIFRDRDLGPWGYIFREGFDDPEADAVVAADPAAADVTDGALVLRPAFAGAPLANFALVAGPRYAEIELDTRLTAEDGAGAALVLAFRDAATMWAARLVPGEAPALVDIVDGAPSVLCSSDEALPAGSLVDADLTLTLRGDRLTLILGDRQILACNVTPPPRGAAGVALVGAGTLHIDSLDAQR